ncbi:hypothetical protein BFJ63_vAg12104 [Fusarium oxysporum f. sp. narcissi]|uniref:Uncharacterized protein n=4 Tax=Fusarium oxysporum TaxID=5507 RepID=A0A420Q5K7_FUSOX|nr:hypothetical protein H9L39_03100 [Fusarium oxysporum f. sp. albedinis]PCD43679.1 hypothetical protein AU210_002769 [Fusarium oxysporum f. sp. radicis-cucumerinum]RKK18143.1 hypothetical protein BFJ65_g8459 [Fusarium oxysporum f. sp. cepae]RKK75774.1 hypothetical protein BFJ69_g7486 [Fusarium oxysporum]RYC85059.1 hypothetical protein BFJ63_vAg12104 [Fusarium oxysporum f. sp. narcissi]
MQRKAGRTGTVAAACGLRLTVDGVSGGAPPRHRHRSSRSSTGAHEGVQQTFNFCSIQHTTLTISKLFAFAWRSSDYLDRADPQPEIDTQNI